jgi:outer membrane protein
MLDDTADPLWSVELTPSDDATVTPTTIDLAAALKDAARLRPEFAEFAARSSQRDTEIELARDALKPQLDLVAGYTMRGLGGGQNEGVTSFGGSSATVPASLSGGLGTSWDAMASQKFPDARVGVVFQMAVGRHEARGKLGAAQAERRQTLLAQAETEQQVAIEVRNAATALETAAGRMQAANAGLAAAETQLRAEQDRFAVGATTNFFVLTRQNDLALAQLAETAALTDYRKALTELSRATGTLLRDRGIEMKP